MKDRQVAFVVSEIARSLQLPHYTKAITSESRARFVKHAEMIIVRRERINFSG